MRSSVLGVGPTLFHCQEARQSRERNGPRSDKRLAQPGEHHEVSVKLDALKATNAEPGEASSARTRAYFLIALPFGDTTYHSPKYA